MKIFTSTIVIALLGLCVPSKTIAQVPGYLGKRAFATLNFSTFVAFQGPTQNNYGSYYFGETQGGSLGINYEFNLDLGYAIGRQTAINLTFGQYYTGQKSSARTPILTSDVTQANRTDFHELFYRLNVKSVGIGITSFRSKYGALAPVGRSLYFGLKRDFVNGEIIDKKTTFSAENVGAVLGHQNLNIDSKTSVDFLIFGWSDTKVFKERFLFKIGGRVGLPLDVSRYGAIFNSEHDQVIDEGDDNSEYYSERVFRRLARHELFRVEVGLGVLLF